MECKSTKLEVGTWHEKMVEKDDFENGIPDVTSYIRGSYEPDPSILDFSCDTFALG